MGDRDWKVKDVMSKELKFVRRDQRLDLSDHFAEWWKIRHLPVVDDNGKLVGLVSHRDLLNQALLEILKPPSERKYFSKPEMSVEQFMLVNVSTVTFETPLKEAAKLMFESKMGCLPVVDSGHSLVGILTEADFVKIYYQEKV